MTVIAGGRVLTDRGLAEPGWVEVDGDLITGCGTGDPARPPDYDLRGRLLAPGFIDQHCHGGGGDTFVTSDPEEAVRAADFHLRHGTTSVMASLVSGSNDSLVRQIETLSPLVDADVLFGIHLEGPWISKVFCGAHDVAQLRPPDQQEVADLLARGAGRIKMVTFAPELPGALRAIDQTVAAGTVAAIGHTDAQYDVALAAIEAGATVATHLGNAMRHLHHREPGVAAALIQDPRVFVELIADGTHIHPAMLRLFHNQVGTDRFVLVTDAMAAAGARDGRYMLGELEVDVVDGVARLVEGGAIAGSTLTLDAALRFMVREVGVDVVDAVTMLSANPARAMGLTDRGEIAPGKRADVVVLDSTLNIDAVMVRGQWRHGTP